MESPATHILSFLLLAAALPAGAATLTLDAALAQAEASNPGLAAGAARVEAVRREAGAVSRLDGFRLRAEAGAGITDQPSAVFGYKLDAGEFEAKDFALDSLNDPDVLAHLQGSVVAERPLDLFGKVAAETHAADQRAEAADAELAEGRLDLRLAVVETYHRVLLAERAVAAARRALEAAERRAGEIEDRVTQGLALPADSLRVRTRRREREADLLARRSDVAIARAALARLLGTPLPPDIALVPPGTAAADGDDANWLQRASTTRPTLRSAAARAAAAGWRTTSEKRSEKPDLALWARAQLQRADFAGGELAGGAGVSLRWSLVDPGRAERRAAAEAAERGAALDVRATEERVRFEVTAALRRLEAARLRAQAAGGGTAEGAEALRVTAERRRAGLATLTDELEAETAALAAETRELEATTEVALAEAALRRAAGDL